MSYQSAQSGIDVSEQAYEIAARVIEVLERDDRLNGTLSEANMDALAEEVQQVLSGRAGL